MRFSDLLNAFARPGFAKTASDKLQQTKTSRAGPMIAMHNIGQPKWTPRRTANLAEEGFRKNTIAYRCVMQIATASAAVPWLLYDKRGHELDTHPLLDLLAHPNPTQDGISFLESLYANLQISGNAYIEALRPYPDRPPTELYSLRPDRMSVIPGPTGLPQGYQYNVNGQVTTWPADPISGASNILHLKCFHPLDDWYGMAPMEAALLSIDQHNASGAWNQALLNQGARPSGALVYAPKDGGPSTLSDDQLQRLREEMGMLYQGDRNAGRPLILEGGLDWREMSLSPKDMDWLAGRSAAARDIALAFGVPAQLIGIPDAQTYANVEQARLAFYEETVLPLVTRVIAGVDHWIGPMYADRPELDFDADEISALTDKRQAQFAKLQTANFLTRNEKREAAGYGPVIGGDAIDDGATEAGSSKTFFNGKYSADQPRVPAGNPDGGQWTSGGSAGALGDVGSNQIDDPPIEPVYPIETLLFAILTGGLGDLVEGAGAIGEGASAIADGIGDVAGDLGDIAADAEGAIADGIDGFVQNVRNILMPDGDPIGEAGTKPTIRELPGGADAAQNMLENLTQGATLNTPLGYGGTTGGVGYDTPDGGFIGYRTESRDGPPTIDVNVPHIVIRKLKFLGD